MNTQNCLFCEKVYEGMEGKLMIVVNSPKNFNVPATVQINDIEGNMDVIISTGSVYIVDVIEEMNIHAAFGCNFNSSSDYVTVSPDEFTHIEVDYDYIMYHNHYRVHKVLLKKVVHTDNSYYR